MEERLKQIVVESLKISPSIYADDLKAGDVPEWDSLGHVTMLQAVQKGFDVTFEMTDAIEIESLGDLKRVLQQYLDARPAR
jgi:acyl carrier protein